MILYPKVTEMLLPIGRLASGVIRRPGTPLRPTLPTVIILTIHNTANDAHDEGERAWLENPTNKRSASWHVCCDEDTITQAIPFNELAYHCGSVEGNTRSISLEITERPGSEKTAIAWIGELIAINQINGIRVELTTHKRWSGKDCPRLILPRWNQFCADCRTASVKYVSRETSKGGETMPQPKDWETRAVRKAVTELDLSPEWIAKAGEPATVGLVCELMNRHKSKGAK